MSFAFWRRNKTAADAPAARSTRTPDEDSGRTDPAATLRARARRRLIGAAALLLAAVIVVPMVLDPEPRPVADSIPIDIPSEKSRFTPRLAPPPAADSVPAVPPPDAAPSPPAAPKAATAPSGQAVPSPPDSARADEQRARAALEGKPADKPADKGAAADKSADKSVKGGKFAVQAAATSNLAAARDLSERLKKAGFTPYTERTETADGTRYRVRVGPYATRDEAIKARARLKSLGINGDLIAP